MLSIVTTIIVVQPVLGGCARVSGNVAMGPDEDGGDGGDNPPIVSLPDQDAGRFTATSAPPVAPDAAASDGAASGDGGAVVCGFVMPSPVGALLPNPVAYDTREADVVTDEVTGLMWQRATEDAGLSWEMATSFCTASRVGGYADWRLPAMGELVSLFDFMAVPPIDATTFPGTPPEHFWTSTKTTRPSPFFNGRTAWYVEFGSDPQFAATEEGSVSLDRVRCVRTSGIPAPRCHPANARYQVSDTLAVDAETGLTWQRMAPSGLTWADAGSYCRSLDGGFRLPTLPEATSLIDYGAAGNLLIDVTAFPNVSNDPLCWTSSLRADASDRAWAVSFNDGTLSANPVGVASSQAFCVR